MMHIYIIIDINDIYIYIIIITIIIIRIKKIYIYDLIWGVPLFAIVELLNRLNRTCVGDGVASLGICLIHELAP